MQKCKQAAKKKRKKKKKKLAISLDWTSEKCVHHYVLNILHIGHSYLTQSFILRREEAPVCVACGAVITVKHTFIECADL